MAVAGGTVPEVSGSELKLLEAIAAGDVTAPELMGFNDWQVWRRTSGTRPTKKKGDEQGRTTKEEADLWRATMLDLFGQEWAAELADKEALNEESDREMLGPKPSGGAAGPSQAEAAGGAGDAPAPAGAVGGAGRGLGSAGAAVFVPEGGPRVAPASQLLEELSAEYDPSIMNRLEWQNYVAGVSEQLTRLGYVVSDADVLRISKRTTYCEAVYGFTLAQAVSYLKGEFGRVLMEEETYEAGEYQTRLEVLMEMLRRRGQEVSQSARRLFSEPVTGTLPSPERVGAAMPHGAVLGAAPKAAAGRAPLVGAMPRFRLDGDEGGGRRPAAGAETPRAETDGSLAAAINAQTAALAKVLASRDNTRHSTIKVSPTFKWPTLGDDGPDSKEIEEFYEKYEDLCRLANDGRGMTPLEHLTTLVSCLRGSKEKIYKLIYRKHRRLGTVDEDPEEVFQEIRARHMKFTETPMERQMRVLGEFDALWKGQKTAHQFEAAFEEALTELELAGLAKNDRELLLAYLQKIGAKLAAEVQKDVRAWKGADGREVSRRAATWDEAHKVLCELEAITASGRALVPSYSAAYAYNMQSKGDGGGKGGGKDSFGGKGGPKGFGKGGAQGSGGKSDWKPGDYKSQVCRGMRDNGTCSYGDACRYSHDKKLIAEEKKRMQGGAQAAAAFGSKGKGKPEKGKGKGKDGGKKNGKGGNAGGNAGTVSRVQFPDKFCPDLKKGQECKYGKECKFSHDKARFDSTVTVS